MTNIEKVKRILDAGHWVKVIPSSRNGYKILTSYNEDQFSCIDDDIMNICWTNPKSFKDCTIEVIQRIPTAYKAGDKVLVLSNPSPQVESIQDMVWNVYTIKEKCDMQYKVWHNKYEWFYFPNYCLAPTFEEDSLSGKEAKIVIDGKEYSVTLKLI